MKKYLFSVSFLLLATIFVVNSCKVKPEPSLFDPNYVSGPQPVITDISPDSAFAGIGILTITGKNFIADPSQNWVYFDKKQGTITEATTTELTVVAPPVVSDSVKIKIAVQGSDKFSDPVVYKLMAAVESMYGFKPSEVPQKLAADNTGNIYFTMFDNGNLADSVYVLNYKTGIRKGFGPALKQYDAMRVGPSNQLYALHGTRKTIYRYPEEGGEPEVIIDRHTLKSKIYDFDFGPNQNLWGAGKADVIVEINLNDKSVTNFDFPGQVTAVKIYNGDIYLATKRNDTHKIYRRHIVSADSLAPEEEYFDLSQIFDMTTILEDRVAGMSFSQDGYLYISCQDDPSAPNSPAVIAIAPGGASFEDMYPVLFSPERKNNSLTWGMANGTNLFISRTEIRDATGNITSPAVILRVNTLKKGATQ